MSDTHTIGCDIWTTGHCSCGQPPGGPDIEDDLSAAQAEALMWARACANYVETLAAQDEELKRLREAVRKTNISAEDAVFKRDAEIERLRGLLREGLRPWPAAASAGDGPLESWRESWERRVKEAIGDETPD